MGNSTDKKLKQLVEQIKQAKSDEEKQNLVIKGIALLVQNILDGTDKSEQMAAIYDKLVEAGIFTPPEAPPFEPPVVTPPPTEPPGTGGGEGKDIYGINKIYGDKEGGVFIPQAKFTQTEFTRNYASGKPSENSYECEYKDNNKLENEEVTFYTQINGFKSEPDTISVKLLGNRHSDGSKDKWLIHQIDTDGKSDDNFQIEDPHPKNNDNHQKTFFELGESIIGKVIGIKAITFIGTNGKRRAETWIDFPTSFENPANNWRRYIGIDDVQSLSHGFLNATNGGALLRIDGTKKGDMPTTKFMSIREIVPLGGDGGTSTPPIPPVEPPGTTTPPPTTEPPVQGKVLYDATIGKWDRNIIITDADPDFPKPFCGGKGMEMHASGNPIFKFDGTGVGTLEADPGHGRTYIDVVNNGSVFEYDLRFNDTLVENHTCQLRSRHQEGEPPENRQGGDSFKIDLKTVGLKLEKFHNEHIAGPEKPHGLNISVGQWVHVKLTDRVDYTKGEIYQSIELDGKKVIENTSTNLPPYLMKKEDYDKRSYLWLRLNNAKKGSISFRNPVLTAL